MVRRNVTHFTSENLPKSSVTICEICKPIYKIVRLEATVMFFVVTDISYGIYVHVQKKCTANLIQDSAFMIEILTGINLL
jgi:hypothetical protein